jgi:hypothetical protein
MSNGQTEPFALAAFPFTLFFSAKDLVFSGL